jgi:short-subunit dehydrogenase
MNNYFKDKVIWITGASAGIGEQLSIQLSQLGAKLILSARREEELKKVASKCVNSESILILPIDLAKIENTDSYIKEIVAKHNTIDILINNAGVSQKSMALQTAISIDRMFMEVNFMSGVMLTKAVLPIMQKNKSGHIVAVSSILGDFGLALHSTYSAAKHATNAFYESLREELNEEQISVTVISPGFIKTDVALNAITHQGIPYNVNSPAQEKGMEASVCASKIIKAIASKKRKKYIGGMELLMVPIHHYTPRLFYWLMKKMSKKN